MLTINGSPTEESRFIQVHTGNVRECEANSSVIVEIDLSKNLLKSFCARDLPNLIILNLAVNQLETFVFENRNLEYLGLSYNKLTSFVVSANVFPNNLRYLCLSYNRLTSFVVSANDFPNLENLGLSYNRLTSFVISDGLPKLKNLDISDNNLTSIDFESRNFPELNYLDLFHNELTSIRIGNFPKLYVLNLCHNLGLSVLDFCDEFFGSLERIDVRSTSVKLVDRSIFPHIIGEGVRERKHCFGLKSVVSSTFGNNPIVDEINEEVEEV